MMLRLMERAYNVGSWDTIATCMQEEMYRWHWQLGYVDMQVMDQARAPQTLLFCTKSWCWQLPLQCGLLGAAYWIQIDAVYPLRPRFNILMTKLGFKLIHLSHPCPAKQHTAAHLSPQPLGLKLANVMPVYEHTPCLQVRYKSNK